MDPLEQIAAAVLYEGYVLWPYRRSARKNQQRWTFGGVYPPGFVELVHSGDVCRVQTECLVLRDDGAQAPPVDVELRFLQVVRRRVARVRPGGELDFVDELVAGEQRILAWDEAVERRVAAPGDFAIPAGEEHDVVDDVGVIVRSWEALSGSLELTVRPADAGMSRVTAVLRNTTAWSGGADRDAAQRRGFMSAHLVLHARDGAFVSMTDPPPDLQPHVEACRNEGLWPVLVGDEHTVLASPIILYDYPQVAPESPGLLFDSSEIDQLLILNTLTLTDAEKAEVRATDPRAREILDRAEALSAEDLSRLHGTIRELRVLRPEDERDPFIQSADDDRGRFRQSPDDGRDPFVQLEAPTPECVTIAGAEVRRGSTVRLHPRAGADLFDLALSGKLATVESIEADFDDRIHLAVTLPDDPGADLGAQRMPGHRFFFSPEEVEPIA